MSETIEKSEYKIPEPKLVRRLTGKTSVVHQLILSPDERILVGIGNDPKVHMWDVETGKLLFVTDFAINDPDGSAIHKGNVAWAPDSQRLFLSDPDGELWSLEKTHHFWQKPEAGKWKPKLIHKKIEKTRSGTVYLNHFDAVAVSSTGLLVASLHDCVCVFRERKWRKPKLHYTNQRDSDITALAFSPNGKRLIVSYERSLDLFDVDEGMLYQISPNFNPGIGDVCDIRWLHDETFISGTGSGSIGIFKNTSAEISRLDFRKNLRALCLVDEETIIICVGGINDQEIQFVRLPDLEILHTMKGFHEVDSIVLYGNGRFMAVSDSQINNDRDWMRYAPAIYDFGSPNLGRGNPTVFNPLPV